MNIEIPEINDLISKVTGLEQRLLNLEDKVDPKQKWFTLKQACLLKGLNYNTVCSRPKLQPNLGKADANIAGRRMWRRETILKWLDVTDKDIKED